MASPSPLTRLQYVDDAIVIAHWHNVRIFLVRGQMEMRHVPIVERGARPLAQYHPQGLVSLGIVAEGAPFGDRPLARRFAMMKADLAPVTRYSATVVEGGGVWARTMRTVLRGLTLLGDSVQQMYLFATLKEALPEVLPHVTQLGGAAPQGAELLRLCDELRAQRPASEAARPSP